MPAPPLLPPQPCDEPSAVTKHPPTPGGLNINEPCQVLGPEPGLTRSQQASAGPPLSLAQLGPGAWITGLRVGARARPCQVA